MTLAVDQPRPPRVKRWTKREYLDLLERGAFRGMRVYLFRGDLIEMPPQLHPHAFAVMKLSAALVRAFGLDAGYEFRIQLPFDTLGETMPEPDAAVCTTEQVQRRPHPQSAVLLVEVADSSLAADRDKALEYAAARVPEYWIVDVNQRHVEVYRGPVVDPTAELGFRYPPPSVVKSGESIEPLAKPGCPIAIAQLFPMI
jgi:Uma2 family endonuclease